MKILKDSLIYLAGELFAKALPFMLIPYLTRRLGPAGFGELSYWLTIFSLLLIASSMSQDGAVTRYFYLYGRRNLPNVVAAGYCYTAAATLVGLAAAWLWHSPILAFTVLAAGAQTLLSTQMSLRQCRKQPLAYTALQLAAGVLVAALTVLLLEISTAFAVEKRFAAIALGCAAVSLAGWLLFRRDNRRRFSLRRLRQGLGYILSFGLPLVLHHAGNYIKGQADRFWIYQSHPAALLGVYSAGYQTASVLGLLLMALNKATVPYYYQALKSGRISAADVCRWALWTLPAAALPALAAYCVPETWFVWLLGAGYEGIRRYVCLFLVGFALTLPYYLLVNYLFYHAQNRRIATVSLLSAGVYLLVLLAADTRGIQWMPLAMISGNAAVLPILYYCVKKHAQGSLK